MSLLQKRKALHRYCMLQIREGSCRIEISWHANSIGVSVKENRKKQERTQTERTIEIDLRGQSGAKEKNEGLVVGVLAEEATEMVGKEAGGVKGSLVEEGVLDGSGAAG
ncbi:hypothetical protein OPV22_022190 [Ensete ventricosum]|uniref:Uncharacterized protein n=1 Tax=Ensete ventricosum TaxID=4639 RepID=A0AAV8QPD2_ENSVE|nr:hypothetical protein OPV22_022190 [Ensete ventricosum]